MPRRKTKARRSLFRTARYAGATQRLFIHAGNANAGDDGNRAARGQAA